jgi:hypothetical protein
MIIACECIVGDVSYLFGRSVYKSISYDMFLTCRNFCGQTERQHELVVYETLSGENPAMMARKDIVELSQLATDRPMVYSKLVKSAHDSIKKELYSAKKQFTDAEFPPNAKSLGHYNDPREKKIVWKRLP